MKHGSRAENAQTNEAGNDNSNSEIPIRTPLEGREGAYDSQVGGSRQTGSRRQENRGREKKSTGQVESKGELLTASTEADLQTRACVLRQKPNAL